MIKLQRNKWPASTWLAISFAGLGLLTLALLAWILLSPLQFGAQPRAKFIVTITSKLDQGDTRHNYERELIRMLLDKTVDEFGPYEILNAPPMSYGRALSTLKENIYPNFIRGFVYETQLVKEYNLAYIPVPILRGLMGYRTCFLAKDIEQRFANATTHDEVMQFSHGYGTGWVDLKILGKAGVNVLEVPIYKSLFKQAFDNKFDLFCRGTNEIFDEYHRNKNQPNFAYDKSKAFFYHFPFFFHSHESNTEIIARISRGLEITLNDGSFTQLWWKYHKEVLDFVKLDQRQIFYFENAEITGVDPSFKQHVYDARQPPKTE